MAETAGELRGEEGTGRIDIQTHPDAYRHWKLTIDGNVARLAMDVDEDATLAPGYSLKLNSYDLGVDIELYDAIQRLRFEHPEVGCVVMTSDKPRVFCAGANINMLGRSSHAHKVNFCKFTNETRNGIEDATGKLAPDLYLRDQRHGGGRRLRARARLRLHHADRRTVPRRSRCRSFRCLRCFPAPAGSRGWSTSGRSAMTTPISSAPPRKACAAAAPSTGT